MLRDAGVNSVNISLDTLEASKFRLLTRTGDLAAVLAGVDAAIAAGFERIRLNAVILRGQNDNDILPLTNFAVDKGIDIAFIEEMPLGQVNTAGKPWSLLPVAKYLPSESPLTPNPWLVISKRGLRATGTGATPHLGLALSRRTATIFAQAAIDSSDRRG